MKRTLIVILVVLLAMTSIFANGAIEEFGFTVPLEPSAQEGTITAFEKYGHALLNIRIDDFLAAGYELGDTLDVKFSNGFEFTGIPFFNGYYVAKGEPMVRAYPGQEFIAVCINYGKVYEVAGLSIGDTVTISLNEKAAALDTQVLNSLSYTNERSDYSSDAVFANYRRVGSSKLYRSCSPVSNEAGRAAYADALIKQAGVKAVLNLADSDDEIKGYIAAEGFASPYYKQLFENGKVVALSMSVDYSSSSFGQTLVDGLKKLETLDGPYLVHCTEGKDRAGFVSALLEALMGYSYDAIVADYMESYSNYYGVSKASDSKRYEVIVNNNINGMLKVISGEQFATADLSIGAKSYLAKYGMTDAQISKLLSVLK